MKTAPGGDAWLHELADVSGQKRLGRRACSQGLSTTGITVLQVPGVILVAAKRQRERQTAKHVTGTQ
jgi:hypothetical protein